MFSLPFLCFNVVYFEGRFAGLCYYIIVYDSFTHAPTIYTPTRVLNCFLSRNYDSEKLVVLVYIIYLDIVPSIRTWKFGNILWFTAQEKEKKK